MPEGKLKYAALDQLLGAGVVPDALLRAGSRYGIRKVLRREADGGPAAQQERLSDLVATKSAGPIAVATDTANEQHYALPPEFLGLFLGPRRKYSACLWPAPRTTLAEAEEASLAQVCERAGIEDGQDILDLGCGWGSFTLWAAEHYPRSRITAVSNSAPQRGWIESEAERRGLADRVRVITADANDLELEPEAFDRVVSIEMFEHLNNWREMLRRVSTWVRPDGKVFLHVFSHRVTPYLYEGTWAAERFFTAGVMPSHDLLLHFQDDLAVRERWIVDGTHYSRTLAAWLERLDESQHEALEILRDVYGDDRKARIALANWRLFLLSCTEIWGYRRGGEWLVSHYLLEPRSALSEDRPRRQQAGPRAELLPR
jgi:cyclopropane-fatty-acyl-phospholipid synthase